MRCGVHQGTRIDRNQLPGACGFRYKCVVFLDGNIQERMPLPPLFAVEKRCAERVIRAVFVSLPLLAVSEAHRVIARDGLTAFKQPSDLIFHALRRGIIVVVPVANQLAGRQPARFISLRSDGQPGLRSNANRHALVRGSDRRGPLIKNEQLLIRVRLRLEIADCPKQPALTLFRRRANAGDKRCYLLAFAASFFSGFFDSFGSGGRTWQIPDASHASAICGSKVASSPGL